MEIKDLNKLKNETKDRIWEEYKEYLNWEEKNNYGKLTDLVEYIKQYEFVDGYYEVIKDSQRICASCNELVFDDYGKQTEHDGFICQQCLTDGYGS